MRQLKMTREMKAIGALGLGIVLFAGQPAAARDRVRQNLAAVAGADARGSAMLLLRTDSNGKFEVLVRGLDRKTTYEVIVAGVKVGTLTTGGGGKGRARFRTRPRGHDLLLGFDPRGAAVVVRNAAGEDVLTGTVPSGSADGSPDTVVCCIPDDRGSECEDRTADECAAQGGSVSTATSCLPNPCDGAPPIQDVVCCIPDDSGPECEDRTATACAAQGGIVVQATSCNPNPCAGTPPANPDIRCCLPDDSGTECEDRTADQCAAQGGIDMGPGSCVPNPCAGTTPGGPVGGDDHGGNSGHGNGGESGGHHSGDQSSSAPRPNGDNHGGRTTYY